MEALLLFSVWSSMSTWLSPSVLFLVLIGTIVLTSRLHSQNKDHSGQNNDPQGLVISRQSSVLERLKSFNLNHYFSQFNPREDEEPQNNIEDAKQVLLSRPPSFLERIRSFQLYPNGSAGVDDVVVEKSTDDHVSRSQSNPSPKRTCRSKKLIRSASERTCDLKAEEDFDYGWRPETTRGGNEKNTMDWSSEEEEEEEKINANGEEVDARADDFINKFRQQLKLQRLDSILRYTELLNRGK